MLQLRRLVLRVLVPALAIAGLSAVTIAALPAGASPSAGASLDAGTSTAPPRVLTCAGHAVVKPASYVLTCADANSYFVGIHWTSWGTASAAAAGTYVENLCVPNCADGRFVRYPGSLTLSKPEQTKYGNLFSVIHYSYTVSASRTLPLKAL